MKELHVEYKTLREIFDHSVVKYAANKSFSQIKGVSYTFAELGAKIRQLAVLLSSCGVAKGDKIVLFSGSQPNWPVAYLAATCTARTVVPLLPDFTAFELANIIEHSEAKHILISKRLYYKLSDAVKAILKTVIILDDFTVEKAEDRTESDYDPFADEKMRPVPEDVASIIYTSGTSGQSKGVMLTHSNLVHQLAMEEDMFFVKEDDVFLSILPLSHAYECSLGMLYPFKNGASVVYLNGAPNPSLLMPALAKVKPTIMLSVPLIVEKIYKNKIRPIFAKNFFMQWMYGVPIVRRAVHKVAGKKLYEMFGGRLRFFGIGGSKLDSMVERFLHDARFPYAIGYGLTETAPLIAGTTPDTVVFQSTGKAVKGIELKINHPTKEGIGEIVVKGPNVMKGYYKDPERTRQVLSEDGWFRTKDLGQFDSKGNLHIKGRVDNMIVGASGENIYPEEIESVINENDFVSESLVVQIKGKLVAKVYFNYEQIEKIHHFSGTSKKITAKVEEIKKEIMQYVNEKVNKFSQITAIYEQTIPFEKTATQKIKRYLYR